MSLDEEISFFVTMFSPTPHTYHVDIGQTSTSLYYYEDFNRLAHAKSLEDSLAIIKACVCYVILIIIIIYCLLCQVLQKTSV